MCTFTELHSNGQPAVARTCHFSVLHSSLEPIFVLQYDEAALIPRAARLRLRGSRRLTHGQVHVSGGRLTRHRLLSVAIVIRAMLGSDQPLPVCGD